MEEAVILNPLLWCIWLGRLALWLVHALTLLLGGLMELGITYADHALEAAEGGVRGFPRGKYRINQTTKKDKTT